MKPQSQVAKSDENLKKRCFQLYTSVNHVNPLSRKPIINKRHSLHVSNDRSDLNVNSIKYEQNNQLKNQLYTNPQQNTHIHNNEKSYSPHIQRKFNEISLKLQRFQLQLDRHNKKIKEFEIRSQVQEQKSTRIQLIKNLITQTILQRENGFNCQKQEIMHQFNNMKFQLDSFTKKTDIQRHLQQIKQQLLQNIEYIQTQLIQIIRNLEIRKQKDINAIQRKIQQKISTLLSELNKQKTNVISSSDSLRYSRKTFIGSPILLKLQSKFIISNMKKDIELQKSEVVYKIDFDGFLLDQDNRYLLNQNNEQIKLQHQQIIMLRNKNVLK